MHAFFKKHVISPGFHFSRVMALAVSLILLCLPVLAAGPYPKRTSNIQIFDQAKVLDEKAKTRLDEFLVFLKKEKNIDFCVYLSRDLHGQDIKKVSSDIFEDWNIGRDLGGKGLLLVVDFTGQKVRLEVGYALEPFFPDSFIGYIEREQMNSFFQNQQYGIGIEATLELIVERAKREHSEELKGRNTPVDANSLLAGGGGATTILAKLKPEPNYPQEVLGLFCPQKKSEDAYLLSLEVERLHIKNRNLTLYTKETREFFSQWTVTNAQMDNSYSKYHGVPFQVKEKGNYAVILFSLDDRSLAPHFLTKSEKGWQMDFAAMNKTIRFNHRNEWNFVSREHPYMFAFDDMRIDRNGFPHKKKL